MHNFKDYPLSEPLLKAIDQMGFQTPSPIQQQTLPILLSENTDFLGLAATGTGKTAAFAIPALEKIIRGQMHAQVLVMCPTRELALQVSGQFNLLGQFKHIKSVAIYGGASYSEQIRGIRGGAQVVVGTPGRIIDHLERGTLSLKNVHTVILDEADEMISMGFKEDIEKILESTVREQSQIWLFSATMDRGVRNVADRFLQNPKKAEINRETVLSTTVEQVYYMARESDKPEILVKLIDAADHFYGVIFCQTKALVQDLTTYLVERGFKVDCLHGDKSQDARERTMKAFRDRQVTILVCTDVAARGLDVKDVTHVVNYSLPRELENYVHRIGRTARSGKKGIAMSLVTPAHFRLVSQIERLTRSEITRGQIPSRRDVAAKKVTHVLNKFHEQAEFTRPMSLLNEDFQNQISQMTPQEVAGRFLALMMPDLFASEFDRVVMKDSRPPREEREDRRAPRDHRDERHSDRREPRHRRPRYEDKKSAEDSRPQRYQSKFQKPSRRDTKSSHR